MSTPLITIFVRHAADCKYAGDEFSKRCTCRKHFRWSKDGVQYRKQAGTRSWTEAEEVKRKLEDGWAGRVPETASTPTLREAVSTFSANKEAQGVKPKVRAAYALELERLVRFSEGRAIFLVVQALTLENLTAFRATWTTIYPSTNTRVLAQKRINHFLKFCYNAGWINRVPKLSTIKVTEPETQPLTEAEYNRLLKHATGKTRVLIQLMRWSGLAIRDASTLKRSDLHVEKGVNKIVRKRTKTGTPLYIPIPPDVAAELKATLNGNPEYVFWEETTATEDVQAGNMGSRVSAVFEAAGVTSEGTLVSHRLRATFAVDLLTKGVPLEHVSKLLGHTSVTTTEKHYAKWVKGRQDLLDTLVSKTWGG